MVKDKGVDTCYSASYMSHATYMSQTCDQRRFTISEVAADWQCIMFSPFAAFCEFGLYKWHYYYYYYYYVQSNYNVLHVFQMSVLYVM